MRIIAVVGPTNVGKTTFLELCGKRPDVGLVQVGKILREKYHPSYFKGEGAPKSTALEAWKLLQDQLGFLFMEGKKYALVDGQPRDVEQAKGMIERWHEILDVIHLTCPKQVREERARARDGQDEAKLALSLARLQKDPCDLYEVLSYLNTRDVPVLTFDTSVPDFSAMTILENAIRVFTQHDGLVVR